MSASSGKIKCSKHHIALPYHSSFISTSFQMHLDQNGLLHGPVHAHASMCMTLPNLEANSSVQITFPIAINTSPLSSFEGSLARQLCPLFSNPHNSKENLRIFNLKIEFESQLFGDSRTPGSKALHHC
jgi:hypothetical protein